MMRLPPAVLISTSGSIDTGVILLRFAGEEMKSHTSSIPALIICSFLIWYRPMISNNDLSE
jgi:hypothetical protein